MTRKPLDDFAAGVNVFVIAAVVAAVIVVVLS